MAGKGNTLSTGILALLFNNTAFTNVATGTGYTNLFVSLHTADPGATGYQNTSEATYNAYARVAVSRNAAGWTVGTATVSPAAAINFAQDSGATNNTIAYFGIGSDSTGSGNLFYSGTVTPNIVVSNGVTPQLLANSTITES